MITVNDITLNDFKAWFNRDFVYLTPVNTTTERPDCCPSYVTDHDLTKAFTEAKINFNEGLFSDDTQLKTTFLYLAAHYLVNDLQTSESGSGSSGFFPVSSRSVGSVSESYSLPLWVTSDPVLGSYTTTRYGQKYLSLIKPLMIGNVSVFQGATTYR
jgi:hypothetical protein